MSNNQTIMFQLASQSHLNDENGALLKILLSLKDYARISVMNGGNGNGNGTPIVGGKVSSDTYVEVPSGTYLQFTFPEAPLLNDITFHLWDYDDRTYTYSIDALSNGEWKNVIQNRQGKGIQYIHFPDLEKVTAIRMTGTNSSNPYFHLLNDWLSFKYAF